MYRDVRVITFIGKEQGGTSSSIGGIIVREFCKGQEVGPVVLLIISVDSEILFQGLIGAFGLPIAFQVISGGEVMHHVEGFTEGLEKEQHKFHAPVRGDMQRNSVLRENMEYKQLGK